jgi:glycosyltransferase involved in cell wall biosynthesis
MKIAFHDNCLSLRGTTVAIYDWAYWTRHYLSIDPIIMYDENHPANSIDAINKFKKEFSVFSYFNKSQIDKILLENQCDAFFMIKGGSPDGVISSVSKNFVNAVSGHWKPNWIHGDVYAMGSKWLSKITNNVIPNVPHMVYLPDVDEDMREELGIPKDALVIGRNGGSDTFDIPFVKQAIQVVLNERKDIWFVFQLTDKFIDHERVIFLPGSSDMNAKVRFINTSDAMLHARYVGESFGLSCAEFSIRNKPVITYEKSPERNHIDTLGEKGIYFETKSDILHILRNLDKKEINSLEWNCYQDYTPEKVVQKFKEVYL